MAEYLIQEETLNQIADAIRTKTGEKGEMTPVEMPEKIEGIKGLWEQIQDGTLTEWVDDEITELTAPLFINYLNLTRISCENLVGLCPLSFYGASNLTEIYLPNLQRLTGINGNGSHFGRCKKLETITFPELISIQGDNVFDSCTNLTVANFPKLVNLSYGMFFNCTRLTSVNLPAITRLDNNVPFSYCSSLNNLRLPSLVELKYSLVYHCYSLKEIDFSALTKISYSGQVFNNCTALESLILRKSDAIVELSRAGVFDDKDGIGAGTGHIYVPAALIEEYKSATNWSTYATQFRALEDYTVDGTITGELDEAKITEVAE